MYLLLSLLFPALLFTISDTSAQPLFIERYVYYPIMRHGSGENGTAQADLTMQSGKPIDLTFSPDKQILWVSNSISHFLLEQSDKPTSIKLLLTKDGSYRYQLGATGDSGTINIQLVIKDNYIQGHESIKYVLGDDAIQFRLAKADAPDPRDLTDIERCQEDGAPIRLEIGATATDLLYLPTIDVYEQIATASSITVPRTTIEIIAGPICMDSDIWWQVRLGDDVNSVAWMPETMNMNQYALRPVSFPSQTHITCAPTLPSRLSKDAYIVPLNDTASIYNTPEPTVATSHTLSKDTIYQITSHTTCKNGETWWYVESQSHHGWVQEIQNNVYAIAPSPHVILTPYLEDLISQG